MRIRDVKPGQVFRCVDYSSVEPFLFLRRTADRFWVWSPDVERDQHYTYDANSRLRVELVPLDGPYFVEWVRYLKETTDAKTAA